MTLKAPNLTWTASDKYRLRFFAEGDLQPTLALEEASGDETAAALLFKLRRGHQRHGPLRRLRNHDVDAGSGLLAHSSFEANYPLPCSIEAFVIGREDDSVIGQVILRGFDVPEKQRSEALASAVEFTRSNRWR